MINKSKVIKDAQKFVAKAQWDKAITEYEKLLAESPSDANTHNTVGDLYLKKNDTGKAIESYKKAADIFNRSGFTLKAIALYKKVLNSRPDEIDILLLMGKLNAERGMLGNANESYLAAAAYFTKHDQRVRAIEVYKTLCDLNPENLSLARTLAELYLTEGFDSDGIIKHIELAEKKLEQGDLAAAGELLESVSHKGSDHPDFMRVSACLDLKSNRLPEAVTKLEEIISNDPDDVRVMSLLAEAYFRSGMHGKSADMYDSLLEKDPSNITYRRRLLDVQLESGDSSAWKECRALVEAHIARTEFEDAERLLEDFLIHRPDSIDAIQQLADLYHKTGHEEETARLHMVMADLYLASAETDKAANIYRELLEKNPDDEVIKTKLASVNGPAAVVAPEASPEAQPTPPWQEETPEKTLEEAMEEIAAAPDTIDDISSSVVTEAPPAPPWLEETQKELEETPEKAMEAAMETAAPDAEAAEDISSAGTVYELPAEPAEFPSLDLEGYEEEGYLSGAGDKVVELPETELDVLSGLDIFGPDDEEGSGPEEVQAEPVFEIPEGFVVQGEITGAGGPPHDPDEAAVSADESLPESLSEIDVYIRSGLIDKAMTALSELEENTAANPELTKRRIEVCKSLGDVEGFVDASVELARMYEGIGQGVESEKVLRKALEIDPGDERLVALLKGLSQPEGSPPGTPETAPEALAEVPEEALVEVPEEALAEVPEEALVEVPEEALAEIPEEALAEIPEEALAEIPEEALAEIPEEALAEIPEGASGDVLEEASAEIPEEALAEAPEGAAGEVLEEASAEIPEEASAEIPEEVSAEIPEEASAEIPEEASAEIPEEASAEVSEYEMDIPATDDLVQTGSSEKVTPGPSDYSEELSEADFYAQQGLTEEASLIYRRLLEVNPDDPILKSRYEALTGPVPEPAVTEQMPPAEGPAEEGEAVGAAPEIIPPDFPGVDESEGMLLDSQLDAAFGEFELENDVTGPTPEGDFFDLAAMLKDELDESGPHSPSSTDTFADRHLEQVFQEFKKGVEEQLGQEDYETHYNLGIAYKEMGMVDEALSEFELAAKDPARDLECASMRGLCFMEKGDYEEAIRHFKSGLAIEGRDKGEYMGLNYDLSTVYELKGDIASAQTLVNMLFREDAGFRDVGERLQRLNKAMIEAGMTPEPDKPAAPPEKSKVSYL